MATPPMPSPPASPPTPDTREAAHRRVVRVVWVAVGVACVALAAAGVVLPLLPTTPFLIVATACFVRGSPRLHGWLLQHRVFGPTLRTWEASRALPPGVKGPAVTVVVVTFALSILAVDVAGLRWMLLLLGGALIVFLLRLPVVPTAPADDAADAVDGPDPRP